MATSGDLAVHMSALFGPISYVSIDTDPDFGYPKGSARVYFQTTDSFVNAINFRFVDLVLPEDDSKKLVNPSS